jgi:hypothetical protein
VPDPRAITGGPDSPQAAETLDSIREDRDGRLNISVAGDYRQKRGTIMSSHRPGEVSNRREAAAIRLLRTRKETIALTAADSLRRRAALAARPDSIVT